MPPEFFAHNRVVTLLEPGETVGLSRHGRRRRAHGHQSPQPAVIEVDLATGQLVARLATHPPRRTAA